MMRPRSFTLLKDSVVEPRATAGTTVYTPSGHDYGLASDDTRMTGIPHTSVTMDPTGDYPAFTVPRADLKELPGVLLEELTDDHVAKVCRPGAGAETCRYLALGGDGWACLKLTAAKSTLDTRVRASTIGARGDNCEGRASYKESADG